MDNTLSLPAKKSWPQKLVLRALSRMDKGQLHLTLPNGEHRIIGKGEEPLYADIRIRNEVFFKRCILYGDIGFGESYVDGDWDTSDITKVISWALLNVDNAPGISGNKTKAFLLGLMKGWNRILHARRRNTHTGSRRNISEHYDLNNDFFRLFLDPSLTYSSALFTKKEMSLQDAQFAKYERLCRHLHLQPNEQVLEIGCGWGSNAIYMAKTYGVRVTALTISREQHQLATQRVKEAGLEDRISILLKDYRSLSGQFDKIVSIEMLEAVGHRFFDQYFSQCHRLLRKNGILALQVITCPDSRYESLRKGVDWIQKHIFPGSLLPSVAAINAAIRRTGDLSLVDLKDMGTDYAQTLKIWREQFNEAVNEVFKLGFDERFVRKWNYYLSYCEAAFHMRNIHVMQLVYTRPNNISR